MLIEVPITKKRIKTVKGVKLALSQFQGKKHRNIGSVDYSKYDIEINEKCFYYPYWIGKIKTMKERPIYKPKEIDYYVVCDALDSSYIVLRNTPPTEKFKCEEKNMLPIQMNENRFLGEIIEDAKTERIDKQFIFGKPHKETQEHKMIYIPMYRIRIREKGQQSYKVYYINQYTGEIKYT